MNGPIAPTPAPAPAPSPAPTDPPAPAKPDLDALRAQFTDLSTKLASADATFESMVAGSNPVGTGWSPHLSALSASLLAARDALLVTKPEVAADLGAKLGGDVRKLSEASGSLSVLARQRATLAQGWTTFLDAAVANATAAADLLKPAPPAPVPAPAPGPKRSALALATTSTGNAAAAPGPRPGDADYCRTPETTGRRHRF